MAASSLLNIQDPAVLALLAVAAIAVFGVVVALAGGLACFRGPAKAGADSGRGTRRKRTGSPPAWLGGADDVSSDPPLPADAVAGLRSFAVTPERGFLPEVDPLERSELPTMEPLESVIASLTASLRKNEPATLRAAIDAACEKTLAAMGGAPVWDDERELRRALLVLTMLTNSYVWCAGPDGIVRTLPPALSRLVLAAADAVGTQPILTHTSAALYDFKRVDQSVEDLSVDNLRLINGFLGSRDEEHFFLVTTEVEWRGAAVPSQLFASARSAAALVDAAGSPSDGAAAALALPASDAARSLSGAVAQQLSAPDAEAAAAAETAPADERAASAAIALTLRLRAVARSLSRMTSSMERMDEGCRPDVFYNDIRPFLAGWRANPAMPGGLVYGEGEPRQCYGGSAAQSSLVQSADAGLGVDHGEGGGRAAFLRAMRDEYMPRPHRELLLRMAGQVTAREAVAAAEAAAPAACGDPRTVGGALCEAFDTCIAQLAEFRSSHMAIVGAYILGPQKRLARARGMAATAGGKGTGGTDLMTFLSPLRDETYAAGNATA